MTTSDMATECVVRMGVLWRGNPYAENKPTAENNRLHRIFEALAELSVAAEPVVYSDEVVEEVRNQLLQFDGVLVWVNPTADGQNRSKLDAMLREVSSEGVWVSAHPDVILKMGTKEVIFRTRDLGWGTDTYLYNTVQEFREQFPRHLASGGPRVLKQNRGQSGDGVWKVEVTTSGSMPVGGQSKLMAPGADTIVRVQHAKNDNVEEGVQLGEFMKRCEEYFFERGCMIDQPFQPRVVEGMIRCYMVHDEVVGFLHKLPKSNGLGVSGSPGITHEEWAIGFKALKAKVESEWVPAMQQLLDIDTTSLPVIWDADFLYGPKTESGEDTYVLCESNVSSVFPFPEEAVGKIAHSAVTGVLSAKKSHV